jgi:hypothetical protein
VSRGLIFKPIIRTLNRRSYLKSIKHMRTIVEDILPIIYDDNNSDDID